MKNKILSSLILFQLSLPGVADVVSSDANSEPRSAGATAHHELASIDGLGIPNDAISATVMQLQGEGRFSPFTNPPAKQFESDERFVVKGVVTAIQQSGLGRDLPVGFFMQDELGDGNPLTSEGIFVPGFTEGLTVGDEVLAYGPVYEHYYWTQLRASIVAPTGRSNVAIAPTVVSAHEQDANFSATLERHENMLVQFAAESDMHVTRTYGFDHSAKRSNMVIAHGAVNVHPNQEFAPGSEQARQRHQDNADRRVVVESFNKAPKGVLPWYPDFGQNNGEGQTDDYIRVGATLDGEGLIGPLNRSFNEYRIFVMNQAQQATFNHGNAARSAKPQLREDGELTIASFNVLNYFNSDFGGNANPFGDSRGAASEEEFAQQSAKIVNALLAIDADIVGLIEVENNGFDEGSAIFDLVAKLNQQLSPVKHYQILSKPGVDYIGRDVITNHAIYRPSVVALEGFDTIELPQQHVDLGNGKFKRAKQRDTVVASFRLPSSEHAITIAVNHFKSKGSSCWEDDQQNGDPDLQGSCEKFRVSAAYQLGEQMAQFDGYKILMGDLNSYAGEDAIMVLTNREHAPADYSIHAARDTYIGGDQVTGTPLHGEQGALIEQSYGYVNVIQSMHPGSFSYAFNDSVGSLDYFLAEPALMPYIIDGTDWAINSVESTWFEYERRNTKAFEKFDDPYRSSDHDPAIVVLRFSQAPSEWVQLPEQPIALPDIARPQPEQPAQLLFDLTSLAQQQIQVGSEIRVHMVADDNAPAGLRNYVVNAARLLTQEEIEQGWAILELGKLAAGDYQQSRFLAGELLDTQTLRHSRGGIFTAFNGSVSSLLLMAIGLLLVIGLRLRFRASR